MIACVLRSGGRYRAEHVQTLAEQMRRVAPAERFVCLSDQSVDGVETIALVHDWPGWWAKLELFRPDVFPRGERVLYADLDTVVLGDIRSLLEQTEPFLALADFYRRPPLRAWRGLGSGLLQWTAGDQTALYRQFAANPSGIIRDCGAGGDQIFIESHRLQDVTFWEDVVPGQVVSYKVHCLAGVPADARVICFHGEPKPWEVSLRQEVCAC